MDILKSDTFVKEGTRDKCKHGLWSGTKALSPLRFWRLPILRCRSRRTAHSGCEISRFIWRFSVSYFFSRSFLEEYRASYLFAIKMRPRPPSMSIHHDLTLSSMSRSQESLKRSVTVRQYYIPSQSSLHLSSSLGNELGQPRSQDSDPVQQPRVASSQELWMVACFAVTAALVSLDAMIMVTILPVTFHPLSYIIKVDSDFGTGYIIQISLGSRNRNTVAGDGILPCQCHHATGLRGPDGHLRSSYHAFLRGGDFHNRRSCPICDSSTFSYSRGRSRPPRHWVWRYGRDSVGDVD